MLIRARQFKKISIRGCVAYGICCLENALEHYNIHGEGWNFLLRKLWWYTVSADNDPNMGNCLPLERWWALIYKIRPHAPRNYEEIKSWMFYKADIPTPNEMELLYKSYEQTNDIIDDIVDCIYDIGTNDLWAGIRRTSPVTLIPLQRLLNIMYKNNIPLPSKEPFKQYVFHKKGWDADLHGFGEMFDGTQYSKFVNSTK